MPRNIRFSNCNGFFPLLRRFFLYHRQNFYRGLIRNRNCLSFLHEYCVHSRYFVWVRIAHLFSFLCCVCFFFIFVLCFMPNVAHECLWIIHSCSMLPMNVSGLSILALYRPWMSVDCPFLLNVAHECLWIVQSCSMLPMHVSGLFILAQCCPCMCLECPFLLNVAHECLWIVHSC